MSDKKNQEIEYKWQATSQRDYRDFLERLIEYDARISSTEKVDIIDQYLDTEASFFDTIQMGCRIRCASEKSEFTVKSYRCDKNSCVTRIEKSLTLPNVPLEAEALSYCRDHFFKGLMPLYTLFNHRQIDRVVLPCGTVAEASFDQFSIGVDEKAPLMYEIEFEFKEGDLKAFKAFVAELSSLALKPSVQSKFERAGKQRSKKSKDSSVKTLNAVVDQLIKDEVEKLKKGTSELQEGCNSNRIHDMRIAIRRLSAIMHFFKELLPPAYKEMKSQLHDFFSLAGKLRDMDHFLEFSHGTADEKRQKVEEKILSRVRGASHIELMKALESLRTLPTDELFFTASKRIMEKTLGRALAKRSSITPKSEDKLFHDLRLSIKSLRDCCEFFEPIWSEHACSLDPLIQKAKKLQGYLGEYQDAVEGLTHLKRYKNKFSAKEQARLKEKYKHRKKKANSNFFKKAADFWFGDSFERAFPSNAVELILTPII